jgi:hypothetical protein
MKAYVAQVSQSELRQFVPEDALPNDVLADLLREWLLPETVTVWAVLRDEDAEAVRQELGAGRQREAHGLFLDRAIDVRPILPDSSPVTSPRTIR